MKFSAASCDFVLNQNLPPAVTSETAYGDSSVFFFLFGCCVVDLAPAPDVERLYLASAPDLSDCTAGRLWWDLSFGRKPRIVHVTNVWHLLGRNFLN